LFAFERCSFNLGYRTALDYHSKDVIMNERLPDYGATLFVFSPLFSLVAASLCDSFLSVKVSFHFD